MTPKFSIIIATYNVAKTIDKCLACIRYQFFKDFEVIIIDGGSRDETKRIIESNRDIITYYKSEPDNGIYDAWNKGLQQATGEWILFIGADDYLRVEALETYHEFLKQNDVSKSYYVSSKVQIISESGANKRVYGWPWTWSEFKSKHIVAHPGSLHRRSLFAEYGNYNTNFRIAGDYELLLRPKEKLNGLFCDRIILDMTTGGVSSQIETVAETRAAQLQNKVDKIYKINGAYLRQYVKALTKLLFSKVGLYLYLRKEYLP